MSTSARRDFETKTIRISVFETQVPKNPLKISSERILQAFADTGIVLLRGMDFDADNFEVFTQQFCDEFHNVGARYSMRQQQGDGYSTEVFRENFALLAHTEGTFRPLLGYGHGIHKVYPVPPEMCFFMCLTPPAEQGGETTLVDGIAFLKKLSPQLRRRFEETGITYSMSWGPERWKNEFYVEEAWTLAELLAEIPGVEHNFQGDTLELFYTTKAVTQTRSGEFAFAPGLLAHLPRVTHPNYIGKKVHAKPSNRVYFGDGEELSEEVVNELIDIHDSLVHAHRWAAKDMLLIDNTRCMHGRTMTLRPCERIIASRFGWLKSSN